MNPARSRQERFWDYRALQFYGELTDRSRGVAPDVQIDYRIDISRPEYCRGQLDRRDDLWIVSSSAFQNYRRLVTDRMQSDGLKAWVYGTSNHVHETNRNIQSRALDAWQGGATGVVPWQTVNKSGSALKEAYQLGLFSFDKDVAGETVIRHSMRLKAYRDAQLRSTKPMQRMLARRRMVGCPLWVLRHSSWQPQSCWKKSSDSSKSRHEPFVSGLSQFQK